MIKQKEDTVMTVRTINEVGPLPSSSGNNRMVNDVRISTLLYPMPYIMSAIGSITPNEKINRKLKIYVGCILESVTLQVIMAFVNTYSDVITGENFEKTLRNFFKIFITVTSLCSLHLLQTTEHTITEVLQEHCYLVASDDNAIKLLRKWSKMLSALGFIHGFVLLTSEAYGLYSTPLNKISERLPYGFRDIGGKYPELALLVVCFQRFVYSMFVQSPLTHHMSFFALICFYLSRVFEAYSRNITQKLSEIKSNDVVNVREICTLYFQLCKSVKTINDIFTNVIFFWCTYAFFNSCSLIKKVIETDEAFENWFLVDLPIAVAVFTAYIAMNMAADSVTKHASSPTISISMYLSENGECRQDVYNLFKMLIDKMMLDPPCLMIWNCLKMNKFFILIAVVDILIYAIVLIQVS